MKTPIIIALLLIMAILITASRIRPAPDYKPELDALSARVTQLECYVYVEDKERFIFKRTEVLGR